MLPAGNGSIRDLVPPGETRIAVTGLVQFGTSLGLDMGFLFGCDVASMFRARGTTDGQLRMLGIANWETAVWSRFLSRDI